MSEVKYGKYSAGNLDGRPKKNYFKVKEGSNIFRVLPPFGSLAEQGVIAKYWAAYWLPFSSGKKRAISSILQMGRDKRIIQDDPLYQKIETLKKSLESMKKDGTQNPAIIEALDKRVYELQVDKAYYLNAISPSGEIGLLKIKYTAFQALKERLRQLEKDGIDPINMGTGVYFDFKKAKDDHGKTVYGVDIHTKTFKSPATGKLTTELVEAVIDETTLKRMEKEAFDLTTLYKILTPEEQAAVATLDPKVMDRIFARPESNTASSETTEEEGSLEDDLISDDLEVKVAIANAAVAAPAPVVRNPVQNTVVTPKSSVGSFVTTPPLPNVDDSMFNDFVSTFLQTGKAQ